MEEHQKVIKSEPTEALVRCTCPVKLKTEIKQEINPETKANSVLYVSSSDVKQELEDRPAFHAVRLRLPTLSCGFKVEVDTAEDYHQHEHGLSSPSNLYLKG